MCQSHWFFFVSTAGTFLCAIGGGIRSSHLTMAWQTPPVTQVIIGALIFRTGFQCFGQALCINTDTFGLMQECFAHVFRHNFFKL
jgi:hypothetical protein